MELAERLGYASHEMHALGTRTDATYDTTYAAHTLLERATPRARCMRLYSYAHTLLHATRIHCSYATRLGAHIRIRYCMRHAYAAHVLLDCGMPRKRMRHTTPHTLRIRYYIALCLAQKAGVCVCVCVLVCVCVCVHIYIYIYTHTYINIHVFLE